MNTLLRRIIPAALAAALILGTAGYPRRADAFLGAADVVIDPAHIAETVANGIADAARFVVEQGIKTILGKLKKRLLDTLTDDIIGWIQGRTTGGPKFVTNFGDAMDRAANEALSDTAWEVAQASFHDQTFSSLLAREMFGNTEMSFKDRLNSTLPDYVGSVEGFRKDFDDGGFPAYRELFNPQNNQWGLGILLHDELRNQAMAAEERLKMEMAPDAGYKGQNRCLGWTRLVSPPGGGTYEQTFQPGDPNWPASDPEGRYYNLDIAPPENARSVPSNHNAGPWRCPSANRELTTPGGAIAEGMKRTLFNDLDYVANAEGLEGYLGAIMDAAFNRLSDSTDNLVSGFLGLSKSQTSTGVAPPAHPPSGSGLLERDAQGYDDQLKAVQTQLQQSLIAQLRQISQRLGEFDVAINGALAANRDGLKALNSPASPSGLTQCLAEPQDPSNPPTYEPPEYGDPTNFSGMSRRANDRRQELENLLVELNDPPPNGLKATANQLSVQISQLNLQRELDRTILNNAYKPAVQTLANNVNGFETRAAAFADEAETFKSDAEKNLSECRRTRLLSP